MSARHFGIFDNWEAEILTCPKCGWSGTFYQGSVEYYEELMDSSCPVCPWLNSPMLAIVSYPTLEEMEANFDKLSDEDKAFLSSRKQFLAEWERTSLKSSSELPNLSASEIVLFWDYRDDQEGKGWTDIRYRDEILWSERAVWEGAKRFVEIVGILRQKYGKRLIDVIPTSGSGLYLYGDQFRAGDMVDRARASLREG